MANKVVGFTIEIDGQKEILTTTKLLGLLNKQLILLNTSVNTFDTSTTKLSKDLKTSFSSFEKGNKIIKDLGNGFFETSEAVDAAATETRKLNKIHKSSEESIQALIDRNKQLKKVLAEAPRAGTAAFEDQKEEIEELTKEYSDNDKAIKAWRKSLKEGTTQTKQAEGRINELKQTKKELTQQYNALTKAQQKGLFGEGARIAKQIKRVDKELKQLNNRTRAAGKLGSTLTRTFTKLFIGRSILSGAANVIRQATDGLKNLVEQGDGTNEVFNQLEESGSRVTTTFRLVGTSVLNAFGSGISKTLDSFAFALSVVSQGFIDAANSGGILGSILSGIGEVITNFPSVFGGVIAVFKEFGTIGGNIFTELSLQIDRVVANAKRIGTALTGGDTTGIVAEIDRINQAIEDNVIVARSIGDAYREGYDATQQAQQEFLDGIDKETKAEEVRLQRAKEREEASKKAAAEEKKRLEDLQRQREKLLETLKSESKTRIEIINRLSSELREAQIAAIKDETEAALAGEKERFRLESEQRKKNLEARKKEGRQQIIEAKKLFGKESDEAKAAEEKTNKELQDIQDLADDISEAKEKEHLDNLKTIRENAAQEQIDADKKQDEEREAKREERRAKLRAQTKARQEKAAQEEEELEKTRKEKLQKALDFAQQGVDLVFNSIAKFTEIANAAETARLDAAISNREASISNLNEQLENATGLQKLFLEQQVKQEEEALKEEQANREAAEKQRVKDAQALALVQAIINGAIAITRAFSDLGPIAGAIAAVGVAAGIAAQIATISSQKFEDGGVLEGPSHAKGGIPFTIGGKAGFEAEGGEAIINKRSTAMFKPLLSAINQAGGGKKFQTGGIVGAPISAPSVAQASSAASETLELTKAVNRRITLLENRQNETKVILDLNNLEDVQDNDNSLDVLTTFG